MYRTLQRISGRRAGSATLLLPLVLLGGCIYGLSGGGFPPHIRTLYIESFENDTPQFALETELFEVLRTELPRRLGIQVAGRQTADAMLTGRIVRYEDRAQNYRTDQSGQTQSELQVLQHQVQVVVAVQIVDVRNNVVLWESSGVTGRGDYQPANEIDDVGRAKALQNVVELITDGAQSQW
ncbi:MAG: LPS assembly lipoprotein LptE [Longimicrobiales bacterium]